MCRWPHAGVRDSCPVVLARVSAGNSRHIGGEWFVKCGSVFKKTDWRSNGLSAETMRCSLLSRFLGIRMVKFSENGFCFFIVVVER